MNQRNRAQIYNNRCGSLFPDAPYSRLRYCFETTPEGDIPLSDRWDYVFTCLGRVPHLFIQLDQPNGRMIAQVEHQDLMAMVGGALAVSGVLPAPGFDGWNYATARLEKCACCGSPGSIRFFNEYGIQFLQISAPSELPAAAWASVLGDIAVAPSELPTTMSDSSREWGHLMCSEDAIEIGLTRGDCVLVLDAASRAAVPIEITARRYEVSLRHTYVIERFERVGYWVNCFGSVGGLSLDFFAVQRSALHDDGERLAWFLLGESGAVLYELRAARELAAEDTWRQIMQTRLESGSGGGHVSS